MSLKHRRKPRRKPQGHRLPKLRRIAYVGHIRLTEEPLLVTPLRLEKDTFSGGYNNTIRERNLRRKQAWHLENDKAFRYVTDFGREMTLIPTHMWVPTLEGLREQGIQVLEREQVFETPLKQSVSHARARG